MTPADRVLQAIVDLTEQRGFPPSVREIGQAVGLSSTSTVHTHLRRLVKEGRISHDPSCPRTIKVLGQVPERRAAEGARRMETVAIKAQVVEVADGSVVLAVAKPSGELPPVGAAVALRWKVR